MIRIKLGLKEIVSLVVAIIVASALIPIDFNLFYETSTTGWSPTVVTLWNLIPLMIILGLVLGLITYAVSRAKTKLDAKTIVEIAIAAIVICALVPTAFQQFYAVNATALGWSPTVVTLWNLIPLMVILALVMGLIAFAVSKAK